MLHKYTVIWTLLTFSGAAPLHYIYPYADMSSHTEQSTVSNNDSRKKHTVYNSIVRPYSCCCAFTWTQPQEDVTLHHSFVSAWKFDRMFFLGRASCICVLCTVISKPGHWQAHQRESSCKKQLFTIHHYWPVVSLIASD